MVCELAAGVMLLAGCQGGSIASADRPAPAIQRPAAATTTTPKVTRPVSVTIAPTSPLSAEGLSVKVSRTLIYDVIEPASGSMRVVVRDAPPDCHCAGRTWWVREYDGDAAAFALAGVKPPSPALTEARMIIDPSGYVAIAERIDRDENVEVVFSPALVVLPNNLPGTSLGASPGGSAAGAKYEQELTMTVHPLGDRSRVKASGKARSTIIYQGDEKLTTPAGTFTARKVVSTLTADLSPARVNNQNELWMVDGLGIIADRDQERTLVFGLPSRSNTMTKMLSAHRP